MARGERSERQAWEDVDALAQSLLASTDKNVRNIGRELMATAAEMLGQLRQGVHKNPTRGKKNPPLVIFGNPPGGQLISRNVHEVLYTHATDGDDYSHTFEGDVFLHAIRRERTKDLLLTHAKGLPLWKDFK